LEIPQRRKGKISGFLLKDKREGFLFIIINETMCILHLATLSFRRNLDNRYNEKNFDFRIPGFFPRRLQGRRENDLPHLLANKG